MIDNRLAPYGALGLRVALGLMFIAHAYLKLVIFSPPASPVFLGRSGCPASSPGRSCWLSFSVGSPSSPASMAA